MEDTMRSRVLTRFARSRDRGDFLVGAAIGSGLLGEAAEDGGADFLVALNAGRFRLMGASSVACTLPIRDANPFVMAFASREILSQCRIPAYFGASILNLESDLEALVAEIAELGFCGVANFPSVVHLPVAARQALEAAGHGFARELALFDLAHRHGLSTLAYVRNAEHTRAAAAHGVDMLCYNFGWNAGGAKSPVSELSVEEAAAHSREMGRIIQREHPDGFFFLEGGPIQDPVQLAAVCRVARMHGYIGGSTIDRLPLAQSVASQTQRFKSATALARVLNKQEESLVALGRQQGFIGRSEAMVALYAALQRFRTASPLWVWGERNTGRHMAIQALCQLGGGESLAWLEAGKHTSARQTMITLFGRAASQGSAPLQGLAGRDDVGMIALQGVVHLPRRQQERIADTLKRGRFTPVGGRRSLPWTKRLVFLSAAPLDSLLAQDRIAPSLAEQLAGREIGLPPLRERTEDIEDLLLHDIGELAKDTQAQALLSPGAMSLLRRHAWPGNLAELQRFATHLYARHGGGHVDQDMVAALLANASQPPQRRVRNERDVLLDALWRHGFHRGATAAFLGISRKTLYNRIRRYGLVSQR